jgi:hypothetical protein
MSRDGGGDSVQGVKERVARLGQGAGTWERRQNGQKGRLLRLVARSVLETALLSASVQRTCPLNGRGWADWLAVGRCDVILTEISAPTKSPALQHCEIRHGRLRQQRGRSDRTATLLLVRDLCKLR